MDKIVFLFFFFSFVFLSALSVFSRITGLLSMQLLWSSKRRYKITVTLDEGGICILLMFCGFKIN